MPLGAYQDCSIDIAPRGADVSCLRLMPPPPGKHWSASAMTTAPANAQATCRMSGAMPPAQDLIIRQPAGSLLVNSSVGMHLKQGRSAGKGPAALFRSGFNNKHEFW